MQLIIIFSSGLLFGIGLIMSGMADPSKVIGFLDVAGRWNPSLAFVMAGAIVVGFFAFGLAAKRQKTLTGDALHLPTARHVDRTLVCGGLVFGVGWGLAGYCPGPALASLVTGGSKPLVFVIAMIAGMALFEFQQRWTRTHASTNE